MPTGGGAACVALRPGETRETGDRAEPGHPSRDAPFPGPGKCGPRLRQPGRTESESLLDQAQTIFFLDAGLWRRLGPMGPAVERRSGKVMMIDHHPPEGNAPAGSVDCRERQLQR